MNEYRLYFLSSCGLHINRFQLIEASTDEEATEVAQLYKGHYPLELWFQKRRVEAFPASCASLAADNILNL